MELDEKRAKLQSVNEELASAIEKAEDAAKLLDRIKNFVSSFRLFAPTIEEYANQVEADKTIEAGNSFRGILNELGKLMEAFKELIKEGLCWFPRLMRWKTSKGEVAPVFLDKSDGYSYLVYGYMNVDTKEYYSKESVQWEISAGNRTNYEVAFSKDRKKWEDYMKREDKLFLNYDEYGKSVVDYALEFKNYDFIKYLISGGHLNFVDNSKWDWGITFGLSTDIKRRKIGDTDIWPIPAPHVPENIFYEERLRTRVLALATEQRDFRMMDELKARMNPAIYALDIYNNHNTHIRDQRNKDFIETIAESQDDIIDYYSSEYEAEDRFGRKHTFIYPYISDVIKIMIANNNKSVSAVIEKCIRHNEQVYKLLSDNMNTYMQMRLEEYSHQYGSETPGMKQYSMSLAKKDVQWGFNYNPEDKIVSFHYSPQRKKYEGMVSNIVIADCKSDNENINKLIQKLNDWADKIIELGKND